MVGRTCGGGGDAWRGDAWGRGTCGEGDVSGRRKQSDGLRTWEPDHPSDLLLPARSHFLFLEPPQRASAAGDKAPKLVWGWLDCLTDQPRGEEAVHNMEDQEAERRWRL